MNFRIILVVAVSVGGLCATSSCSLLGPNSSTYGLRYAPDLPDRDAMIQKTLDIYSAYPNHYDAPFSADLADRSKLEIQPPIARYILGMADVADGRGLEAAKLDSYYYYIKNSGEYVGVIEGVPVNGAFRVKGKNGGWFNLGGDVIDAGHERLAQSGIALVLKKIQALPQLSHDAYELRFLELPPLGLNQYGSVVNDSVVWLKCNTPGGDLIYTWPGDTVIKDWTGLKPDTVYAAGEVLKPLQLIVRKLQDGKVNVHEVQARSANDTQ